jgi:hypothetical protein
VKEKFKALEQIAFDKQKEMTPDFSSVAKFSFVFLLIPSTKITNF